jgi:hypothetical protein
MSGRVASVVTTHELKLVGVPNQVTSRGEPFLVELATVRVYLDNAYVTIQGRAVRVDGTVGRRTRYRWYDLRENRVNLAREPEWAPRWLDELLASVGVEW